MTTAATSLLGLALPVSGELSGVWGDTVNTSITALLDSAVAGTTTLSADADVTLTTTTLAANQAREAIILWTAAGTLTRYITAPAQSKTYVVLNKSSTQSIVLRGVGPTTGVTVLAGKQAMVAWDGADFVEVSSGYVDGPASSTDNAIARFDGTDGKLIQNSVVTIADTTGNMAGVGTLGVGAITTTGALVGAVSQDAFNTVSTTLNIGGAATTIGIGAATGTLTVNNTTLAAKAITASTTLGVTGVSTLTGGAVIQGLTVGLGLGAVASNTAIGVTALAANTTANATVAVGYQALQANTTGSANSALGSNALASNISGVNNTGIGANALKLNTASSNTAVGKDALQVNTSGANNVAMGYAALYNNTTASNNTAVGYQAGYANTTGSIDAFGYFAGSGNTTGVSNVALGANALSTNSTGSLNNAVGRYSLYLNTTGSNNTALGHSSLQSNTTASNNTAVGYQAGYSGTTGAGNVSLGYQAGYTNNAGGLSVFIGYQAGYLTSATGNPQNVFIGNQSGYNTTGTNNTFVGGSAGSQVTTGSKNTIIGEYTGSAAPISATGSNYIVLSDGDGNVRGTFDSSGSLGVGVTPVVFGSPFGQTLQLPGGSIYGVSAGQLNISANAYYNVSSKYVATGYATQYQQINGTHTWNTAPSGTAGTAITFTQAMTLDASGNGGIGVTPSAWGNAYRVLDVSNYSALAAFTANRQTFLANNAYNNNTNWIYKSTGYANYYRLGNDGNHDWWTAASGTAGTAITFTQAMTLDASGNLGIGTTSPSGKLHVNTAGTSNYIINSSDTADGSIQGIVFVGGSLNRAIIRAVNESTNGGSLQFFTYTGGIGTQNMTLTSGGNLGIGVTSPSASAILDAQSTTKGVRMPNMTTTQKNAIASPAAGLMVFDTTLAKLSVYSGAAWQTITSV